MSITGKVYVQSVWPPRGSDNPATQRATRLLASIEGLAEALSAATWPEPPRAGSVAQERLERARAAIAADFYNEGLPLAQLKAEGIILPSAEGD